MSFFFFSCYTHTTTFPSRKDVSAFLLCLGQDYVSQSLITFLLTSYSIPHCWPPLVWYFWETQTRLLFGWTPAPSSLYQSWIPLAFATLFPSSPLPTPSPTRFSPAWKPGRNLWHLGADVFCTDVWGVTGCEPGRAGTYQVEMKIWGGYRVHLHVQVDWALKIRSNLKIIL